MDLLEFDFNNQNNLNYITSKNRFKNENKLYNKHVMILKEIHEYVSNWVQFF